MGCTVPRMCPVARHFGLPALTQYDVASAQAFCHCSATCVQNCMGLIAAVCKASAFAPAAPYRPVSTLSSTRTRGLSLRGDGAGDDASDGALEACFYSCRIIVRSLRHLHERLRHSRQLVRTGALCRNASSSICLTRKSATSAREMNPHVTGGRPTHEGLAGVRPGAHYAAGGGGGGFGGLGGGGFGGFGGSMGQPIQLIRSGAHRPFAERNVMERQPRLTPA